MIDLVRARWPHAEISFLVREYTKELVEQHPEVSSVLLADHGGRPRSGSNLLAEVQKMKFDVAVHVYPRPQLAWLTCRAGIPVRVGTAFRWYSLLFNRRVRDHRKSGERHEAVLNARLLASLGIVPPEVVRPNLQPAVGHLKVADRVMDDLGLRPGASFVILHPGSGGSSRNWPPARFAELTRTLARTTQVVVTGAAHEADLVSRVIEGSGGNALACVGRFSLMEFAAFISKAVLFISNSTGPIHMAAAVGTPVVGFYPPLAAAKVSRWGPLGDHVVTFTPDPSLCPMCHGRPCRGAVCMEQIGTEAVATKAMELMKQQEVRQQ